MPEAAHHHPALAHHFDDLEQQKEASTLGMWVFLVTEVLFFGGLFATYCVYRSWYPGAFAAGSHELGPAIVRLLAWNTNRSLRPVRAPLWLPTPARWRCRRALAAVGAVIDEAVWLVLAENAATPAVMLALFTPLARSTALSTSATVAEVQVVLVPR